MTLKGGMLHRVREYYQVCSNNDAVLTLTYLTARSTLVPYAIEWEEGKIMDFSETIVVYDIKVGRFSQLNQYMNFMNIRGYGHSLAFVQAHSDSTFSNFFCSETARPIEAKFHMVPPWDVWNEDLFKCSRSHDHAHIW